MGFAQPVPRYVETSLGQIRVWQAGTGQPILVLPGMMATAKVRAARMAAAGEITAFELPGFGAFPPYGALSLLEIAEAISEAARQMGLGAAQVLAHDLCIPLGNRVSQLLGVGPAQHVDIDLARGWMARGIRPPPTLPRADGLHLNALWTFLRDLDLLEINAGRVRRSGEDLFSPDEMGATLIEATRHPGGYSNLWQLLHAAFPETGSPNPEGRFGFAPAQPDPVRRGYIQTPEGLIHFRECGRGPRPLLMFQSAPGSCAPLEPVMRGLTAGRRVIAADYLGNGESAKPDGGQLQVADLARNALHLAGALGLETFDLWGTHTGALVALELSLIAPERVGRMVMEAPILLDATFTQEILAKYFIPLRPDPWGQHLLAAWNMRRDMFLFWPWYRRSREAARMIGVPDTGSLHDWTVGLLQSGDSYANSYRAGFSYPTVERLRSLSRPALICAGPADMLVEGLELARRIAPEGTVVRSTPATVWYPGQQAEASLETLAIYDDFLRER